MLGVLLVVVTVGVLGDVAVAALAGRPSDPPTGVFPPSSGELGYAVAVTPNLDGGGIGWCLTTRVFDVGGGSGGGGGCNGVARADQPIIAWGAGGGGERHGNVYATTTDIEFMTTAQVAAVRASPSLTILTRPDKQLPSGYRIAIAFTQSVGHAPAGDAPGLRPFGAVALNGKGQS